MGDAEAPAHQPPNDDRATHRLFTGRHDKQPGADGTEDAKNTQQVFEQRAAFLHRFSHVAQLRRPIDSVRRWTWALQLS